MQPHSTLTDGRAQSIGADFLVLPQRAATGIGHQLSFWSLVGNLFSLSLTFWPTFFSLLVTFLPTFCLPLLRHNELLLLLNLCVFICSLFCVCVCFTCACVSLFCFFSGDLVGSLGGDAAQFELRLGSEKNLRSRTDIHIIFTGGCPGIFWGPRLCVSSPPEKNDPNRNITRFCRQSSPGTIPQICFMFVCFFRSLRDCRDNAGPKAIPSPYGLKSSCIPESERGHRPLLSVRRCVPIAVQV